MQSELEAAKQAAGQAKAQAAEIEKIFASLNSELEEANAQRSELQTKLDQAQAQLKDKQSQLEGAQSELEAAKHEADQAKAQAMDFAKSFASLNSALEDANAQLAVSYTKVGDVVMAQGNLAEALKSYRDGLSSARLRASLPRVRSLIIKRSHRLGGRACTRSRTSYGRKTIWGGRRTLSCTLQREAKRRRRCQPRGRSGAGRPERAAIAVLTDWLASHPDDTAVRFALSTRYIEFGQLDAARSESERILAKAPDFAANLNNLAWLYGQTGDKDKALTHARPAYQLSPGSAAIADTLGWLLAQQGDTSAAMPLLVNARKGAPANPEIGYHYAWVLAKDGAKGKPRRCSRKFCSRRQRSPSAKMPSNWVPLSKDRDARCHTCAPENVGRFAERSFLVLYPAQQASTELPAAALTVRGTPTDGGAEILLHKPKARPRCLVRRGFFADLLMLTQETP